VFIFRSIVSPWKVDGNFSPAGLMLFRFSSVISLNKNLLFEVDFLGGFIYPFNSVNVLNPLLSDIVLLNVSCNKIHRCNINYSYLHISYILLTYYVPMNVKIKELRN
jgi:hypothetical protein